jgi:hypothetical protein
MSDATTVEALISRSLDAYAALAEVGEAIDDEWTYVDDLSTAWRERLGSVAQARAEEDVDLDVGNAIEAAIDEIGGIDDPHRAIDWLSTFPQVVLLALREPS